MTAALTTLSHEESYSAKVEFFTQEDLEDIEDKHKKYKKQWDELYKKYLAEEKEKHRKIRSQRSPEDRARIKAKREMSEKVELVAAYEQYTKRQETEWSIRDLEKNSLLEFEDVSELDSQLKDYVGATGTYMPFTKSVNIRLPQENLKDVEIVDTPGINDPVQSREERTREHLKQCDVVLIVSPAGQFMSEEDLKLMDRITSKEGVRELYVVAAQADLQLYGSLRDENNGQLDRVLDSLTKGLGAQLKKVVADLKESNSEVGDTYDSLLEGQSKVVHSSGICESLRQHFRQRDEWDEGMLFAWKNLQEMYQDYFSDTNEEISSINLDKLSNISTIQSILGRIRTEKQKIIENRSKDYTETKRLSLNKLKNGLLEYINDRQGEIEKADIEKIKEQLTKNLDNASTDIKSAYKESVDSITTSLNKELQKDLKRQKQTLSADIERDTGTTSEPEKREKSGLFPWVARILWEGGYETYLKNYTTVRTTAIFYSLELSTRQ